MRTLKTLCIVAIFGMGLFASCTPENLDNDNTEEQVDNTLRPPRQG